MYPICSLFVNVIYSTTIPALLTVHISCRINNIDELFNVEGYGMSTAEPGSSSVCLYVEHNGNGFVMLSNGFVLVGTFLSTIILDRQEKSRMYHSKSLTLDMLVVTKAPICPSSIGHAVIQSATPFFDRSNLPTLVKGKFLS